MDKLYWLVIYNNIPYVVYTETNYDLTKLGYTAFRVNRVGAITICRALYDYVVSVLRGEISNDRINDIIPTILPIDFYSVAGEYGEFVVDKSRISQYTRENNLKLVDNVIWLSDSH